MDEYLDNIKNIKSPCMIADIDINYFEYIDLA